MGVPAPYAEAAPCFPALIVDCFMLNRSMKMDPNQIAARVVAKATHGEFVPQPAQPKKNRAAVSLGRRGGKVGGPARAAALTPEQRAAIAKKGAEARWGKK